jgi:hypothetical protein
LQIVRAEVIADPAPVPACLCELLQRAALEPKAQSDFSERLRACLLLLGRAPRQAARGRKCLGVAMSASRRSASPKTAL